MNRSNAMSTSLLSEIYGCFLCLVTLPMGLFVVVAVAVAAVAAAVAVAVAVAVASVTLTHS